MRSWSVRDYAAAVVITLVWLRAVGPLVLLTLVGDKTFVPVGQPTETPDIVGIATQASGLLLLAVCAGVVVVWGRGLLRADHLLLVALLAPWLWMVLRDALAGTMPTGSLSYPAVVLALLAVRPHPRVLAWTAFLVWATAAASLAVGWLLPEAGILREPDGSFRDAEKALVPDLGLLQGVFTSENNLALFVALGLPLAVAVGHRVLAAAMIATVFAAVVWSSSRGGALVAGASVLTWVGCVHLVNRWPDLTLRVRKAPLLGLLLAYLVALVLPVLPWDDEAFSERGLIWTRSLRAWGEGGLVPGLGSDWYSQVAASGVSPLNDAAYHGHNMFVHSAVTGGLVLLGVLMFSALVVTDRVLRLPPSVLPVAVALTVGVAAGGLLEVVLAFPDRHLFWTVSVVPLVVLLGRAESETPAPEGSAGRAEATARMP